MTFQRQQKFKGVYLPLLIYILSFLFISIHIVSLPTFTSFGFVRFQQNELSVFGVVLLLLSPPVGLIKTLQSLNEKFYGKLCEDGKLFAEI